MVYAVLNRCCGPWTPHGQVMCVSRVRSLAQNPDRTSREGREKEASKGLCQTTNNWTFKTRKCSLRKKRDCVELELGCMLGKEIGLLKGKLRKLRIPVEQEFCVNVSSRRRLIMTSWPTVPSPFGRNLRDP